jgi:phosphoadenosine phosphosulfate reductase
MESKNAKEANFSDKIGQIKQQLEQFRARGQRMFLTSSFQTHSLPILHIIAQLMPEIPVYFLNTGYHFVETIRFRDLVTQQFGLNLKNQTSYIPKSQQRDAKGNLYFASDPDYCCFLNKTQPTESILNQFDVWINGVRADQNANRQNLGSVEAVPNGKWRYHPMLDWTKKEIFQYIKQHELPRHPLDAQGYISIGCEPCTRKPRLDEREGRWFGLNKTECGLHTDLIQK